MLGLPNGTRGARGSPLQAVAAPRNTPAESGTGEGGWEDETGSITAMARSTRPNTRIIPDGEGAWEGRSDECLGHAVRSRRPPASLDSGPGVRLTAPGNLAGAANGRYLFWRTPPAVGIDLQARLLVLGGLRQHP